MTVTMRMAVAPRRARGHNDGVQSARKVVGGVVGLVTGAARHAVWYVRYQLEGQTREQDERAADEA
jgi:hypothetical protein